MKRQLRRSLWHVRLPFGMALLAFACTTSSESFAGPSAKHRPRARTESTEEARAAYRSRLEALSRDRGELAKDYTAASTDAARAAILEEARTRVLTAFVSDLFPAWKGTTWDFNGTSRTPGEGKIACGYFVTTLLEHAGFHVERAKLAQEPSENIVKTLAPKDAIWRFRKGDTSLVIDKVREEGDGLYVVGLDNHVGFLLQRGGDEMRFCHASYVEPAVATCELAREAPAFASNYHIVGRVLNPQSLVGWLEGTAFETVH